MELCKGYKFDKKKVINKTRSTNPLAKLSYKELQKVALQLHLPANLQHKVLLAAVIAKKQSRDDIVNLIVKAQRKRKRKTAPGSESSLPEQQQLSSAVTPSDVSQIESKFEGNMPNLNNWDILDMDTLDTHEVSYSITNDVLFPNVQECTNNENIGEIVASLEDLPSHSTVGLERKDLLTAPSASFDSGIYSFTSLDFDLERELDQQFQFLGDETTTQDPLLTADISESIDISIVDILESLSENQ